MMLSYVGHRAMGALVYEPELPAGRVSGPVNLLDLHEAAMQVERSGAIDLDILAEVGTSAGGARPKALIGLPRDGSDNILTGAGDLPLTHEAWLVKLDTSHTAVAGVLEEAYSLMARAAGVDMPPTCLLETRHADRVQRHFAVRRFDRDRGERIHHHTLAAMCHMPGCDLDYQTFLRVTRRITRDEQEVWRAYRRAVFNVLASNRDDHGKNHGFLYRDREWKLGPAYDITFSGPRQLPERGMSIGGERRNVRKQHLVRLAESEALDRRQALDIMDEVAAAIAKWPRFADEARVPTGVAADVAAVLGAIDD
jgi:serine/threonine-protein kinase HipA